MSLGPIDPEKIIRLLLNDSAEPYPFSRLIALLTLCAWMRWPDDPEVVLDAQTTAAAMVCLKQRKRRKSHSIPLTLERACETIVNRQIFGTYDEAFDEPSAVDIVSFFMHCPEELQPSLGKAYHFVGHGGFVSSDFDAKERKQMIRARSSLKAAWKLQARSSPLLWAIEIFEEDNEVYCYSPDALDCFKKANALVQNRKRLLNLFGLALFCQQKMTRLLRATGATTPMFLRFPKIVQPVEPDIGTFDEDQLKILAKYAAPQ
jgi:hypothetical protein